MIRSEGLAVAEVTVPVRKPEHAIAGLMSWDVGMH